MIVLATAFPSDGKFDELWYYAAFGLWAGGSLSALVSLVLWVFPKSTSKIAPVVALTAIALSIYPIVFGSYLHHIDFVAEARDGTRASPPYWKALGLSWLPFLVASSFLIYRVVSRKAQISRK